MAKRVTFCVSCQLKKQDLDIICTIKGADSHSKDAMQHIEGAEAHIKRAEMHMVRCRIAHGKLRSENYVIYGRRKNGKKALLYFK